MRLDAGGLKSAAGDALLGNDELDQIFDEASLARELRSGRVDKMGRFDEQTVEWDITKPGVDQAVSQIARRLKIDGGKPSFQVVITHDVDRTTASEATALVNALRKASGLRTSPCFGLPAVFSPRGLSRNIKRLLEFERAQGVGAFYFMMAGPYGLGRYATRTDVRWGVSREIARNILSAGMMIGLHGSFFASDTGSYAEEKDRIEQATGTLVSTHRNHYLRFDPEKLPGQMEAARIGYDFSVGYGFCMGFRAGMASCYPAFDWKTGQTAKLQLIPLIFMENLLLKSDMKAAFKSLCDAILLAKEVSGCVSLLFHPETFVIEPKVWPFFQDIVLWCREQGADLSGKLPASRVE